jgi:hypothetical protein
MSRSHSAGGEDDEQQQQQQRAVITAPPTSVNQQEWYTGKMSLAVEESDREWLSEINCYVRSKCVEAFSATAEDVASSSKRGRITIHQVGIRCRFCAHLPSSTRSSTATDDAKEDAAAAAAAVTTEEETTATPTKCKAAAAVSFPTSVSGIYESVKRWQRVHMEACDQIPEDVRDQLSTLANTNVWVPTTRQYWTDAARALGLVDTNEGIRFGQDPAGVVKEEVKRITKVPSGEDPDHAYSSGGMMMPMMAHHHYHQNHHLSSRMGHLHHAIRIATGGGGGGGGPRDFGGTPPTPTHVLPNQAQQQQHVHSLGGHIVYPHDMEMIPPYVYFLMRQVEPCLFTEADRFVARSKGPVGYPGFQCSHCNGHAGLGKYFPVSSKSLSTNSTSQNIHAHMLKCRKCPDVVKDRLVQLKIEKSRAPRLEPGWRKVFFDQVWARLHTTGGVAMAAPPPTTTDEDEIQPEEELQPEEEQLEQPQPQPRETADV